MMKTKELFIALIIVVMIVTTLMRCDAALIERYNGFFAQ